MRVNKPDIKCFHSARPTEITTLRFKSHIELSKTIAPYKSQLTLAGQEGTTFSRYELAYKKQLQWVCSDLKTEFNMDF